MGPADSWRQRLRYGLLDRVADDHGASQMGAHVLPDPVSGSLYITEAGISSTVAETSFLVDVLWYNTGLAVAAGAQAITQGTLPARDIDGTANGRGVQAAIFATSALGNVAAVATTTITYTDQDGNAGNTGTFTANGGFQSPATPVIGTWVPFTLAAGDTGIRSIQSFNTGTTYTSGTFSLVMFRPLVTMPNPIANAGVASTAVPSPGIKVWPNSCIWALGVGSSNANNLLGTYTITER